RSSDPKSQAAAKRVDPLARPADAQGDASPAMLPIVRDATGRTPRERTVPPPAATPIESSSTSRSRAAVAPPPPEPVAANAAKAPKQKKEKSLERLALAYVGADP